MIKLKFKFPTAVLLNVIVLTTGCASQQNQFPVGVSAEPRQDETGAFQEPVMTEEEAGAQIHERILADFRPYTEPDSVAYFNEIADKLAAHADRKELSYQVTLLYNDEIYATSAPGGRIYITTGMIYFLDNESQAAAVLAHEIGELQFRDPRLGEARGKWDQVLQSGTVIAPAFGQIGALAALGLVMLKTAADSRKGGGAEIAPEDISAKLAKADEKALHYMNESGYDPQGMIDLMYKFLEAKNEMIPYFKNYYQARPITEQRMFALQKTYADLPMDDRDFSVNRTHYLEMTKGIREIHQVRQTA